MDRMNLLRNLTQWLAELIHAAATALDPGESDDQ
jgi:hypothetical protein